MKKIIAIILVVLCTPILHAQNNSNKELSNLFLNLKLELVPDKMIANSNLKFEKFVRDNPDFQDKETIFLTEFTENKAIKSKIVAGEIQIIQRNAYIEYEIYRVVQNLKFETLEDLQYEYNKLTEQYEKLGRHIQVHTDDVGDEYFVNHINKTIIIDDKLNIRLDFSYSVPRNKETGYHLFIQYSF